MSVAPGNRGGRGTGLIRLCLWRWHHSDLRCGVFMTTSRQVQEFLTAKLGATQHPFRKSAGSW